MPDLLKNDEIQDKKIRPDMLRNVGGAPEATEIGGGNYAVTNIFGNIGFVVTDDGIVVIDAGVDEKIAELVLEVIRAKSDQPIKYLIYTHGHGDHAKGGAVFKRAGASVIAHKNVAPRFDRYAAFSAYHARINAVQFASDDFIGTRYWENFAYPDIEYSGNYTFELGGKQFLLRHEKGETDDGTVVTVLPDKVVYAGDLVIWAFPNIGNPNKVLRYEREWAEALNRISESNPKSVVPGHGPVLSGDEIGIALNDAGEALRILYEQSKQYINEGRDLDYIIENTVLPEHIKESPYIREIYGTREFALRGIHRRYTGWYDGNPSNLNPAPKAQTAAAVFALIGDRDKILQKAKETAENGDLRLALHVVDLALGGNPNDAEANALKAELLKKLGLSSENLFYRNFYLHESEKISKVNAD